MMFTSHSLRSLVPIRIQYSVLDRQAAPGSRNHPPDGEGGGRRAGCREREDWRPSEKDADTRNGADPTSGMPVRSAIDTVERFWCGERTLILVSATTWLP